MALFQSNTGGLAQSVATLFINSLIDSQRGDTLTNFKVYLETGAIRGAKHMEITAVNLQNWIKPFHSLNNNFIYLYNGTLFSMGIDTSIYYSTPADVVAQLNLQFTNALQNVVVAYSATTNKLTFTTPGGTTFQGIGHFDTTFQIFNRANLKLGFINYVQPVANGSTVSADIPLRILNNCIHIGTNLLFSGVQPSNLNLSNLTFKVPINVGLGQPINFVPSTDQIFDLQTPVIDQIQFQIYDENFLNPEDLMETGLGIEVHFTN
jgi:hypothetical protein